MGGNILSSGSYLERTYYSLPSHDIIYFQIRFIFSGQWQSAYKLSVEFDHQEIIWTQPQQLLSASYMTTNLCGGTIRNYFSSIYAVGKIFHTNDILTVTVRSDLPDSSGSFGIRGLRFSFGQKKVGEVEGSSFKLTAALPVLVNENDCIYTQYPIPGSNPLTCGVCSNSGKCDTCYGPTDNECYGCYLNRVFDGVGCIDCPSNCCFCTNGVCVQCISPYKLNSQKICVATCDSSEVLDIIGSFEYCKKLCPKAGQYILYDDSCSDSCDHPLTLRDTGQAKFCESPCYQDWNEFLYWNGSRAWMQFRPENTKWLQIL